MIITGLIVYTAVKADIAEYHEAALKAVYADFNEDMQDDTRINHIRRSVTYMGNPAAG
jgi:hypothetical protein